jgi:hypothetical protein
MNNLSIRDSFACLIIYSIIWRLIKSRFLTPLFIGSLVIIATSSWLVAAPTTINQQVQVFGTFVKVRAAPPALTDTTNRVNTGDKGITSGGPTPSSLGGVSYVWWKVNFESGITGWVASIYLEPISLIPASPTGLSASGGNNRINLSWSDNSNNETGFKIDRKADANGIWSQYDTVGANITSASDVAVVPGRDYYYRVYAYNAVGNSTNYTNEASASPIGGVAPSVTTQAASSIAMSSAQMNGTINPNGYATSAYFQFGTTTSYGRTTGVGNFGNGISAVPISSSYSGIPANTTFHYRAVASNSGGTIYGEDITFTTLPLPGPPTIIAPGSDTTPGPVLGTLTPTFEWNVVNGATGYGLYIRDLTTNTLVFENIGGAKIGTSFALPPGYFSNNGHTYRWAMTSFAGAYESAQSNYRFFIAPAIAIPVLNSITPNSVVGFNGARTFTLSGSNFVSGATLHDNFFYQR